MPGITQSSRCVCKQSARLSRRIVSCQACMRFRSLLSIGTIAVSHNHPSLLLLLLYLAEFRSVPFPFHYYCVILSKRMSCSHSWIGFPIQQRPLQLYHDMPCHNRSPTQQPGASRMSRGYRRQRSRNSKRSSSSWSQWISRRRPTPWRTANRSPCSPQDPSRSTSSWREASRPDPSRRSSGSFGPERHSYATLYV